ncbi:VWA domain-containing protein [Jongsikchunia kroppenstedtii]|uniref:VWA domain-containing protein n=1 Tax=Jongsikchunia kroppenstedtii TaxID=1121721 RepID=UPI00036A4BF5|nr:VWA domain-containing protein [Jongsikchunia kroppenstedtii]
MFDLAHPWWLLLLIPVAALAAGYVFMQYRRHRRALLFANLEVLEKVAPKQRNLLLHIPIVLMVAGLVLLTIALAGPQADRKVPRDKATVVLVIDVSLSMQATDVAPSRLVAAQKAAKQFADELPSGINMGLISFAGTATTLVTPSTDRTAIKNAIDKLQLAEKTATGEGIYAALDQITTFNNLLGGGKSAPPARVVLESDGKETVPQDPDNPRGANTAARKAKELKVPVSTISFGTKSGSVQISDPQSGEQQTVPVPVDDPSLKKIADISGGSFFTASSLDELKKVYGTLQRQIGYTTEKGDNSHPWVIWGTLLVLISALGAVALNRRLP